MRKKCLAPFSLLMCRPTFYRIAYEINPWMSIKHPARLQRAVSQWNKLYETLTQKLGVRVQLLPPHRDVPDLVFTANAGLVKNRLFIRSNFRFPQRKKEEPYIARHFRRKGFRVATLDARFGFEGEGDALWFCDTLIFGFHFRSDAPAHEALARLLKAEVLPVELIDKRFYHLDTCFAPLNEKTALWFPKAFDRYSRRVIKNLIPDLITVSESDAKRFACNTIALGKDLVLPSAASPQLRRQLKQRGFNCHLVDLSEFLKAGGCAKCLVLHLN